MIQATIDQRQAKELQRMITNLPKAIRNKVLRQELRAAARPLVAPSKAATPSRTGQLRRSVKLRAAGRSRSSVGVTVGYSGKAFTGATFYGSFLEWGWRIGKRPSKSDQRTDNRKKIEGRFILTKIAQRLGPGIVSKAITAIARRVEAEARNG